MYRIALTALLCSATYALPHKTDSTSAPLPTHVAVISAFISEQHPPIFLESPLSYTIVDGHGKPATQTVTQHTTLIWNEGTQSYEGTGFPRISVSTQPLATLIVLD